MKTLFISLLAFLLFQEPSVLAADIRTISTIEEAQAEITDDTLVLFNIAEVLLDNETSLGTANWRRFLRKRVDAPLHDSLTLLTAERLPPKPPEPAVPAFIKDLQERGITVLALTSRGRHEWYSTQLEGIDTLTEKLLNQIDIDFTRTQLPAELARLDETMPDYYHAGILYATNNKDKGELLQELFAITGYRPAKVVFIDDKIEGLSSVGPAMESLGIPFSGLAYNRTALNHQNFDIMISMIQLEWLCVHHQVITDVEAAQIKSALPSDLDAEIHFKRVIEVIHDLQRAELDDGLRDLPKP